VVPPKEILEYIRENYSYDTRGWINGPLKDNIGEFSKRPDGKVIRRLKIQRKNYKVHHIVWFLCKKHWPTSEIDHIDRDTLNNKVENLRDVDSFTQNQNKENYKGYKGFSVFYDHSEAHRRKQLWRVRNQSQDIYLGRFYTEEECYKVIDRYWEERGEAFKWVGGVYFQDLGGNVWG